MLLLTPSQLETIWNRHLKNLSLYKKSVACVGDTWEQYFWKWHLCSITILLIWSQPKQILTNRRFELLVPQHQTKPDSCTRKCLIEMSTYSGGQIVDTFWNVSVLQLCRLIINVMLQYMQTDCIFCAAKFCNWIQFFVLNSAFTFNWHIIICIQ